MFEAERALSRAIVYDQALTVEDRPRIRETKKVLVEGGGLLEFVPAPDGLDQVGGLEKLKKWVATRKVGFLPAAGEKPLDPPRGILLLGVQGCGKSLAAKSIAATWGLPLLALDAGKLLAPYIGESERNLRDALKRVERMAPCVLWIDEIEKAFVSARTSESDGGVSKRLVATLLTWMQERAARVFLVATANSVDELPPEMMRKGRDRRSLLRGPSRPRARGRRSSASTSRAAARTPRGSTRTLSPTPPRGSRAPRSSRPSSPPSTKRGPAGSPWTPPRSSPPCARPGPFRSCAPSSIDALRHWAKGRCVPAD